MAFSKKFDFLMNLTATSNSMLAQHMRLDPSYISRLRHGSRSLPRGSEYLPRISAFLLRRCTAPEQRQALCRAIGSPAGAQDDAVERQLARWLCSEDTESLVGELLSEFSSVAPAPRRHTEQPPQNEILSFYGDEGRRQATIELLSRALQQPAPVTVLLYSDEAEWMNKTSSFSYEWTSLLWQLILRGGRVKVIHKVSRDIDEMFDVIRRWLPLYVTGAVEAYYYPRLRDGIYKRTLSVIPGLAAAFSTSIGQQEGVATTFLTTDQQSVDSFTNEFSSYVALCRPLIESFASSSAFPNDMLVEYLDRMEENILFSNGLPVFLLPQRVARRLSAQYGSALMTKYDLIRAGWNIRMTGGEHCRPLHCLLHLADPAEAAAGRVPVSCSSLLHGEPVYYEADEYCAHLEHILRMLEQLPWFHITLLNSAPAGYSLNVFCEQEVYIFKEEPPYCSFRIRESNTVMAFWDYLQRMLQEREPNRKAVAGRIQNEIQAIRALQKAQKNTAE